MNELILFFANLSNPQKLIWILSCLLIFWVLEGLYPLRKVQYNKWEHALLNFVFLGFTIIINVLFGIITVGVFSWLEESKFGLLNWFVFPTWVELIISILILDFIAQYVVHFLLHKISFMWRFHMVHHSDTDLDVTSGTRHHPGDFIIREFFALIAVVIAGLPFAYYIIYRLITIFCTYFSHANIRLPLWLDKGISMLFISPNMHKFHHHFERPWTDSNFGNIFSIWDRFFGTFVYEDTSKIVYGLDVLKDKDSNDIFYQLNLPFNKKIKTDY
ncbi:sterol desaturase family protein [Maribacter sp.]|uniref:sterol desaturase family protein n=1 Tax=Maribacter sp. TaxID=1897614 RepID=UPI0025C59BF2|nr:sterol desaturase family protein [Maribacter sp.]